jgi:hypothetical protein
MAFTDEQLTSLAYNDEAPTSTQLLARELIELRARPRDAFHTMDELYDQRMLWNALAVVFGSALRNILGPGENGGFSATKSWFHHDGEPCFGKTEPGERWFIVTVHLPNGDQVSQHYPERDWDLFRILDLPAAPHWDGHTPQQAEARIRRYLLSLP